MHALRGRMWWRQKGRSGRHVGKGGHECGVRLGDGRWTEEGGFPRDHRSWLESAQEVTALVQHPDARHRGRWRREGGRAVAEAVRDDEGFGLKKNWTSK